jgi:hypothetical protein
LAIKSVKLLGADNQIRWTRDAAGLHLQLPAKSGEYAYVFRISK